jgi:hypothetical protein
MSALLGWDGAIELYRHEPPAVEVEAASIAGGVAVLDLDASGYWSGDRVRLESPVGLPIDIDGDGIPETLYGLRMYTARPAFYSPGTTTFFYPRGKVETTLEAYVAVDGLDRARFYRNELDAINGRDRDAYEIFPNAFGGPVTVTPLWDDAAWRAVCNLTQWSLETTPDNLDTAAIGEDFGSYVRGIVRGAGAFVGWVSQHRGEGIEAMQLARLALLGRRGSIARGRFLLGRENAEGFCEGSPPLYYEGDLLIGRTTVSIELSAATSISGDFVITGPLELSMERRPGHP